VVVLVLVPRCLCARVNSTNETKIKSQKKNEEQDRKETKGKNHLDCYCARNSSTKATVEVGRFCDVVIVSRKVMAFCRSLSTKSPIVSGSFAERDV